MSVTGPVRVHPSRDDGVVAVLSEVVGGPMGTHARRARWLTATAVLVMMGALAFSLGLFSKSYCASQEWNLGDRQFTHLCYSDVPYVYTDAGLDQAAWPFTDDAQVRNRFGVTSQPALVAVWNYGAARITQVLVGSPDLGPRYQTASADLAADPDILSERRTFAAVEAVGLGLAALVAVAALSKVRRRRPWDAALMAASPVLVLAGFVSFDLLAVAGAVLALWAWSRGRVGLAGVFVGLGAAAGVWPALLLIAFGLTEWRRGRGAALGERLLPAAVTALAAWAAGNAPGFLTGRAQWDVFWTAATHRGPEAGSFWAVADQAQGIPTQVAIVGSWVLMALWLAGVVVLTLRARVSPSVSQVAFLLVAGVLLSVPDYRPQQALWLLPLAALARPRWRDHLVWQGGEVVYFAMVWWWLAGRLDSGDGNVPGFYWVAVVIRLACTAWLVAMVIRDVRDPRSDPAADERYAVQDAADDPGGAPGQDTRTSSNVVAV